MHEARTIRIASSPWLVLVTLLAAAIPMAGLWAGWSHGMRGVAALFASVSLVGAAAAADILTQRLRMGSEDLTITTFFRQRRLKRQDVAAVKSEGGWVFLRHSGQWVRVPDFGRGERAMRRTIDLWLKGDC